jgi:16S rRNA (cytosine967-C5)-methyltransferase
LEPRERSFAHELTFGVTRLRGRLDHLIAPHVRRGLESVDTEVLELLRLGAYQILYMGSVPEYAGVSETVDQIKEAVGGPPAGFANAVLRKVAAAGDGPARFPAEHDDVAGYLESWGSHPRWLIDRWLARWTPDEVRRLVIANNRRPATHIVPLEGDMDQALERLAAAGFEAAAVGQGSRCLRLHDSVPVREALAAAAPAIVQDPAANLVSVYADVPSGTMVADLCAAPGGKALALPARPEFILAADRSESRIRMLKDNAHRVGLPLALVVADALHPPVSGADVVLLDAPCTGTGTMARHPDARWRLRPDSLSEMASLQRGMLEAAADSVCPGGLVVYSTCTLEPEENEELVEAFLSRRADFSIEDSEVVPASMRAEDGSLVVLPQNTEFDGAFAARLRRTS